ncbi:MAG: methyltransferase domain-containing protein [Hyphomicrobiales bacterium]|nr:methyltransferase domain-containing protein [Hyphomicrobiales bacterium]
MTNQSYVIATGQAGRDRLRVLTRVFAKTTARLLDEIGVAEGMSCLDVGCGGGDVSVELARRVGPGGRVVGLDLDVVSLEIARNEAAERKLTNITYRVQDVFQSGDLGPFDIVYARFLLSHLPEPMAALARMVGTLGPGGTLAVEDVEFSAHFCYPDCPAFREYVRLYSEAARARGDDPDIGPRLPSMLRDTGLADIGTDVAQPAGTRGEAKLISAITMEDISQAVVSSGLASQEEAASITERLYAEARDERTVLSTPRVVQTWGRKP